MDIETQAKMFWHTYLCGLRQSTDLAPLPEDQCKFEEIFNKKFKKSKDLRLIQHALVQEAIKYGL